jgi:hypothetical protein
VCSCVVLLSKGSPQEEKAVYFGGNVCLWGGLRVCEVQKLCWKAVLSPHLCRGLVRKITYILFMRFLLKPVMYSIFIIQAYCASSGNTIKGHITVWSSVHFQKYELKLQYTCFGVGLNVIYHVDTRIHSFFFPFCVSE